MHHGAVLSEIKDWNFSCGIAEGIPVTLHTLRAKSCAERCDEDLAAYEYQKTIIAESRHPLGLPLIGAYQNCVLCRYVWYVINALADLRNEINSGELTAMFWSVTSSGIVGVSRCRRQLCSIIMTGQALQCDLTNTTFNSRIIRDSKVVLIRITNGFVVLYAKIWRFKTQWSFINRTDHVQFLKCYLMVYEGMPKMAKPYVDNCNNRSQDTWPKWLWLWYNSLPAPFPLNLSGTSGKCVIWKWTHKGSGRTYQKLYVLGCQMRGTWYFEPFISRK